MIQDKIQKGDLVRANRNMWGHYFLPDYGNINIEIKKNMMFVVTKGEIFHPASGHCEIQAFIDNKIIAINIKESNQLGIVNVDLDR